MIDSKMVFIDTSPFIYYLQHNDLYYSDMKLFWERYADCNYVTSSVTITEYLTYPYCHNDLRMIDAFYAFIDGMDIKIRSIDRKNYKKLLGKPVNTAFFNRFRIKVFLLKEKMY